MSRKPPSSPTGAPAWIVTYGDMMSLLLCFFILLAAMANYDKPPRDLMEALQSIQSAFNAPGQIGRMADRTADLKSLMMRLQSVYTPDRLRQLGQADLKAVEGEYYRVQRISDGIELRLAGPIAFERFGARLLPESEAALAAVAGELRGKRNKVDIRGHATVEPLPKDSPFADPLELSFARARAVRDRLVELGVDPRTLRTTACGATEPILSAAYEPGQLAVNRRVEIVVMQSTISEFAGQPAAERGRPSGPN